MKIKHNRKHNVFSTLLPLGLVLIQICMLVGVMAAIIVCSAGAANAQEQPGLDYGDAPDSYGTLLASNGARHTIVSARSLGSIVDAEPDGQATSLADGDDLNPIAGPDDEDGVTLPPSFTAGDSAATVTVDGGASGGMLDAWIDLNGNGVFDHPAEHLWGGTSQSLNPGPNNLTFAVPTGAVPGPTYARFRLSISGGLAPTGSAPDGEVEDYLVEVKRAIGNITIAKVAPGGGSTLFHFGGDLGLMALADGYAGTTYHIPANSYIVTEVVPSNWALIDVTCVGGDSTPYSDPYGEGVTVHLDAGEHITCTFTNEHQIGNIAIAKVAPGGGSTLFHFGGDLGLMALADGYAGTTYNIPANSYTITEVVPADWALIDVTCEGGDSTPYSDPYGEGVTVHLDAGEHITCTFTNEHQVGNIAIAKVAPGGGSTLFHFGGDLGLMALADGYAGTTYHIPANSYTITEVVPADWKLVDVTCEGGDSTPYSDPYGEGVTIHLDAGEHITCTFTNEHQVGNITIAKEVPGGSSQLFHFGGDLGLMALADGYAGTQYNIPAASYVVTEVVPADWALIDVTCEGGDSTPYSDPYGEGVMVHLDTGEHITCTFTNEQNQPPTADPNGSYLGAAGSTIAFDGTGSSDPDNDPLTYAWDFGDSNTATGATPSHTYSDAGIYDVCLTVNDGHVDSDEKCTIAVVYDPGAGFVTGGGWIDSPAGAYVPDPSLTGEASFGFVSRYKKGATVPTGNTEFQFKTADLNFHSSSYDWLVVTGSDSAKFKGSGTINGEFAPNGGEYEFMLWARDKEPDTFRIKIWWEENDTENVVYDNGQEGSGYENGQPIGGGSIVVHTAKK